MKRSCCSRRNQHMLQLVIKLLLVVMIFLSSIMSSTFSFRFSSIASTSVRRYNSNLQQRCFVWKNPYNNIMVPASSSSAVSSPLLSAQPQQHPGEKRTLIRLFSSKNHRNPPPSSSSSSAPPSPIPENWMKKQGQEVWVEVISFGPLGATVHVIGIGSEELPNAPPTNDSSNDDEYADDNDSIYGIGLISQQELSYFRASRDHVDVVRGEVLKGYIERIRDMDEKVGIGLRPFGGKQKTMALSQQILDRLEESRNGSLSIGDKSSPEEIAAEFPGTSKSTFKKTVSALYKQGLVQPGPYSITMLSLSSSSSSSSSNKNDNKNDNNKNKNNKPNHRK